MAKAKNESVISAFLKNRKVSPLIAALAAGLYPIFFYYTNNYTMIGSWEHMGIFLVLFLVAPIVIFWIASKIIGLKLLRKLQPLLLPFLNLFFFLFYIKIAMYAGMQWAITVGIFVIAILVTLFLRQHFKKWVVVQLVLAVIGFVTLVPRVVKQLNYSKEWKEQPDSILEATFVKKPNIYLIQPDGYVNFSELKKGKYQYDNSVFENFLQQHDFKSYANFRSNYGSTLATNSSLFMMKHHYYNDGSSFSETTDARNVIITENAVLSILKNNGYKTSFFSERPYFFVSRPKLGYDKSNFTKEDVSYITTGMTLKRDVIEDFKNDSIVEGDPTFTFIQIFNPSHITRTDKDTKGVEGERKSYLQGIEVANNKLQQLITLIEERDPEAMVVIMADHGGFVGYEYTAQTYKKTDDVDLRRSIFSAMLTIKWPSNVVPEFDDTFKSPVNLFRILTAYLSKDPSYLDNLQNDGSYMIIKEGAPKGIYQYLDKQGQSIFKKQ